MHTRIKLTLTAITTALVLALVISTASANNLSISHGELAEHMFSQLKFKAAGTTQFECDLSLEASFHVRTFAKIERTLVGYITRAILGRCNTGSGRILTESLPWHIQYRGFNGSLPTPRPKFGVIGSKFIIASIFGNCLWTTTEASPLVFISEPEYERGGNGLVKRDTVEPGNSIPTTCGINTTAEGTGSVFESAGAQTVLLRLI